MDEQGFAQFASSANLSHRARVTQDEADAAIRCLEEPDANSSDPDNDGRRIERVHGGWVVLNAPKYRELVTRAVAQEKTRGRVAEFRARKKTGVDERIREQDGKCACCFQPFATPFRLYVVQDHDHATGVARGMICQSCNKVVGFVDTDRPTDHPKKQLCLEYVARYKAVTACNAKVTPSEASATAVSESSGAALPPAELPLNVVVPPPPEIPYVEIVAEFHNICVSLPRVTKLNESRKRAVRARFMEAGPEPMRWFTNLFTKAHGSDFVSGRTQRWSGGSFDWLMNPTNALKVIEGNYENKVGFQTPGVHGKVSSMAG